MIRGDQLADALGAYDRWMTFHKLVDGRPVGGGGPGKGGVKSIEAGSGGATSGHTGGTGTDKGFVD